MRSVLVRRGLAGGSEEGQVRWLQRPSTQAIQPDTALLNDLPAAQGWPWVEVVLSAAGASGRAVDALVDAQVNGPGGGFHRQWITAP